MQLDAAHLRAGILSLRVDVVDIIVLDQAEHGAEMAADPRLLAVEDLVVPDDVRADVLFAPSLVIGLEDGLQFPVEPDELPLDGPPVLTGGAVLAQADAAALGIADDIVLDDPSLAPVGAYQTGLEGRGRRPVHGRLGQVETLDRDEVDAWKFREEHGRTGIDFHQFLVRVGPAEIGPEGGFRIRDLGIPLQQRRFRLAGAFLDDGIAHLVKRLHLEQRLAVQIHFAEGVSLLEDIEPVSPQRFSKGVEIAEEGIGKDDFPDVGFFLPRPSFNYLGALDPDFFSFRGTVDDSAVGIGSRIAGLHPLAVDAGMDGDRITGAQFPGGPVDGEERRSGGTVVVVRSGFGDVEFAGIGAAGQHQEEGCCEQKGSSHGCYRFVVFCDFVECQRLLISKIAFFSVYLGNSREYRHENQIFLVRFRLSDNAFRRNGLRADLLWKEFLVQ